MSQTAPDTKTCRELVALWGETGRKLAQIRAAELAAQTPEESRRAAYDMLQLGGLLAGDPERARRSGLVEMQRRFASLRERGRT
jgi:hypothetical protein